MSPAIVAEKNIELCCLLLVFSLAGFAFSTPADVQPEIMVLGSDVQTYDIDAIQWEFPLTLTGFGPGARTARLVEFSIDGHDLLPLVPEPQRTLPGHRLDNEIGRENFRTWNNYRKRAAILREMTRRYPFPPLKSASSGKDLRVCGRLCSSAEKLHQFLYW